MREEVAMAVKGKTVSKAGARRVGKSHGKMKLKVVIHKAEEGGYWAEVPGFPGCVSEGESLDEVRTNIKEAFEGVFEAMQDDLPSRPGRIEEIDL
jgi:predicted RNase H-like HicB family nuclease